MRAIPSKVSTKTAVATSTSRGGTVATGGTTSQEKTLFFDASPVIPASTVTLVDLNHHVVVDFIASDMIQAAVLIRSATADGTFYIEAFDSSGTSLGQSQPTAFTTTTNGFVILNWKHGITTNTSSRHYFRLRYTAGVLATTTLSASWAFIGTSIATNPGGGTPGGGTGGGPGPGTGGPGTPGDTPPPVPGAASIRDLFLARYPHASTTIEVNGTDINLAIAALPPEGGIILVGQGTYEDVVVQSRNFTGYALIMAAPGARPIVRSSAGNQGDAFGVYGSSYVAVFGFEIIGHLTQSELYSSCMIVQGSHHVHMWACVNHEASSHGFGSADGTSFAGGTYSGANHMDVCYNIVYNTSYWMPGFASGISHFRLANIGGGDDSDGYSCRIVGNIVYNNFNDPSYGNTLTDGNGIIIDVAQQSGYTGHVLMLNNLCVSNGGGGVLAFMSDGVDQYFNTCAYNQRSSNMEGRGEIGYNQCGSSSARFNVVLPNSNRSYWAITYASSAVINDNVILAGSNPSLSGQSDHTADGASYFVAANAAMTNFAGFKPANPVRFQMDAGLVNKLVGWPDALGNNRPSSGNWAAGALEA